MYGVVVRSITDALCRGTLILQRKHTNGACDVRVMHVMRTSVTHRAAHIDALVDMDTP